MPKDWDGNKKSTYVTLGASNHTEHDRQDNDYYATHPSVIKPLFDKESFALEIWECACGEGHLSKAMEEEKEVYSSDIVQRGYAKDVFDFLKYDVVKDTIDRPRMIITNPPFDISREIIRKAMSDVEDNGFVIMLQRVNFMGGVTENRKFWEEMGMPRYIFVHRKRMSFTGDGKTDSIEYAHYVWQKGFNPEFSKLKIIDSLYIEKEYRCMKCEGENVSSHGLYCSKKEELK